MPAANSRGRSCSIDNYVGAMSNALTDAVHDRLLNHTFVRAVKGRWYRAGESADV